MFGVGALAIGIKATVPLANLSRSAREGDHGGDECRGATGDANSWPEDAALAKPTDMQKQWHL